MDNQDLSVIGVVSGYEHRGIKAPIIGGGQVFARIEENVGITTAFLLMGASKRSSELFRFQERSPRF
jgi:hypothetical protein